MTRVPLLADVAIELPAQVDILLERDDVLQIPLPLRILVDAADVVRLLPRHPFGRIEIVTCNRHQVDLLPAAQRSGNNVPVTVFRGRGGEHTPLLPEAKRVSEGDEAFRHREASDGREIPAEDVEQEKSCE